MHIYAMYPIQHVGEVVLYVDNVLKAEDGSIPVL